MTRYLDVACTTRRTFSVSRCRIIVVSATLWIFGEGALRAIEIDPAGPLDVTQHLRDPPRQHLLLPAFAVGDQLPHGW